MKKSVLFVIVFILAAGTVFAQSDMPTEAEAARVIEGYWRSIGNGDFENLKNYATKKTADFGVAISATLDETQKKEYMSYKADITEIRPMYDRVTNTVFIRCFTSKALLFSAMDIIKENGVWKIR